MGHTHLSTKFNVNHSLGGPAKSANSFLFIQWLYSTSLYLWKFHSLLFASSPLLYLASLLLPPPSHTPLEEACSATQNTLINMKEVTN